MDCIVIEDADSGIEAALAAGMKAVGVSCASDNDKAHFRAKNLNLISIDEILEG